jgi:hypothetical protein
MLRQKVRYYASKNINSLIEHSLINFNFISGRYKNELKEALIQFSVNDDDGASYLKNIDIGPDPNSQKFLKRLKKVAINDNKIKQICNDFLDSTRLTINGHHVPHHLYNPVTKKSRYDEDICLNNQNCKCKNCIKLELNNFDYEGLIMDEVVTIDDTELTKKLKTLRLKIDDLLKQDNFDGILLTSINKEIKKLVKEKEKLNPHLMPKESYPRDMILDCIYLISEFQNKNITYNRRILDYMADWYGLNSSDFKNKRLLVKGILSVWKEYFEKNKLVKQEFMDGFYFDPSDSDDPLFNYLFNT